jgi:hypothetical protein
VPFLAAPFTAKSAVWTKNAERRVGISKAVINYNDIRTKEEWTMDLKARRIHLRILSPCRLFNERRNPQAVARANPRRLRSRRKETKKSQELEVYCAQR